MEYSQLSKKEQEILFNTYDRDRRHGQLYEVDVQMTGEWDKDRERYCRLFGYNILLGVTRFNTEEKLTDPCSSRDYNIGTSDYSKHNIQPWDIWEEYKLNPWDADIVKRVLRTKSTEPRKLDYEKIIHICKKRIEQIDNGIEV